MAAFCRAMVEYEAAHTPPLIGEAASAEDSVVPIACWTVPIPAPLPRVPKGVVQPESVGLLQPDGLGSFHLIISRPGDAFERLVVRPLGTDTDTSTAQLAR